MPRRRRTAFGQGGPRLNMSASATPSPISRAARRPVRLFLCGDVMIGRGIDQILRYPCDPLLHESYAQSANDYVQLAEAAHGRIPRGVDPSYVWGAALDEFKHKEPDARIINLETAITRSDDYEHKGINYRTSPENAECLKAAAVDCCVLGNNHILDWGRSGLRDTLTALEHLRIKAAGAGRNLTQAAAPAVLDISRGGRVLVFSFACVTSGAPRSWAATGDIAGVNLLGEVSEAAALRIADEIAHIKRADDLIVVSVHWGPNWGYEIPNSQRNFAHALIDHAGVSVIHGHSSHHPKAVEIYRDRLILYGCGDFLNDYEGIKGYEEFRDDLVLMYFADLQPDGALAALDFVPLQIRNFKLIRPSEQDIRWMQQTLDRENRKFGAEVVLGAKGRLTLSWKKSS